MINLKFSERSLLYGYSYLWAIVQVVFPPLNLQEPRDTKNLVLFHQVPIFRDIFYGPEWASVRKKWGQMIIYINLFLRYLFVALHLFYLICMVFLTFETQTRFLKILGVEANDSLSFKVLYYTPLFIKVDVVLINLGAVKLLRQREWTYYDKYDIFSLSYRAQLNRVILTLLAAAPNGILELIETIYYISLVPKDTYWWIQKATGQSYPFMNEPIIGPMIYATTVTTYIFGNTVRSRPLLNIIYAATCVNRHLHLINQQMIVGDHNYILGDASSKEIELSTGSAKRGSHMRNKIGAGGPLIARDGKLLDDTIGSKLRMLASGDASSASSLDSHQGMCISLGDQFYKASLTPKQSRLAKTSSQQDTNSGESSASSQNSQVKLIHGSQLEQPTKGNLFTREMRHLLLRNGIPFARKIGLKRAQIRQIRNLRQLELHIGRLQLFVSDMDKTAGSLVYSLCLLSLVQFIHSAFFLLEFWNNKTMNWPIGILYCLSRLTTPGLLFMAGDTMEREAKRLAVELELVYLQKETSCLIYKQYSSTMASLSRIIKLLDLIKFDCDGLMDINIGTMQKFIFYSITTLFIVFQFDALNVLYDKSESVLNSTTRTTLTTTASPGSALAG